MYLQVCLAHGSSLDICLILFVVGHLRHISADPEEQGWGTNKLDRTLDR